MKYRSAGHFSSAVPISASGAIIASQEMTPWQPSTWPEVPDQVDAEFVQVLETVFQQSILVEIKNVIEDAKARNGDLQNRGHVVAISMMCALDAISAFGYRGTAKWKGGAHIKEFIRRHFSDEYKPYAKKICDLYRNSLVHSWNLFEVSIYPGDQPISSNGTLSFGLLHFQKALETATDGFLKALAKDKNLQMNTLKRYRFLRKTARP